MAFPPPASVRFSLHESKQKKFCFLLLFLRHSKGRTRTVSIISL